MTNKFLPILVGAALAMSAAAASATTLDDVKRILGVDGTFGEGIGLTNDWGYNVIKAIGNYGEIFDRNIGAGSPLKIERGLNALWTKGGIQYGPPIR